MPANQLPIYSIQDFNSGAAAAQFFYFETFAAHLKQHKFIQKPHKHDFYIVLFITQGTGNHTIDFKDYAVHPGAVFFLTPGQVHSWQLTADADGFILFFTPSYYREQQKLYHFPYFATMAGNAPLLLNQAETVQFLPLLQAMQLEYGQQQLLKDDLLRDYLDILLIKLLRIFQSQHLTYRTAPAILPEALQLQQLIDLHYTEHRPVSFYADKLHTTAKHLNEISKKALGKTTSQLLQERLLLEAKRLLIHSAKSIKEVANTLGFSEITYFFRFFKKHAGHTPEQFRQEQHNHEQAL